MTRWQISGIVEAPEWDAQHYRFKYAPGGQRDFLYLPADCFTELKVERAPAVFVEGWWKCNTGQWGDEELYLSEEAPDLKTKLECETYCRGKWIYLYSLRTEPGEPPRLKHCGGINWGLNWEKWDLI